MYRLFPNERYSLHFDSVHLDIGGAARFTEYIGAGIPIVFTKARFQSALNKIYRFGIEVAGFKDRLINDSIIDRLSLVRSNCERIRGVSFNIDTHISRVVSLYGAVSR